MPPTYLVNYYWPGYWPTDYWPNTGITVVTGAATLTGTGLLVGVGYAVDPTPTRRTFIVSVDDRTFYARRP